MDERWTVTLVAKTPQTHELLSGDVVLDDQIADYLGYLDVSPIIATHGPDWVAASFVMDGYDDEQWDTLTARAVGFWERALAKIGLDGTALVRVEVCRGEVRPSLAPPGADPEQAWYWTPEWLEGQRRAERDVAWGNLRRYTSTEDFIASLGN